MTDEEIQAYAESLILQHNDHYEFDIVYEDDDIADFDREVLSKIYNKMFEAKVTVSWDN